VQQGEIVKMLSSFGRPIHAMVAGASGAIGGALVEQLASCPDVEKILACSRQATPLTNPKVVTRQMDILDEASIVAALAGVERIDLAIVATGVLHEPGGMQPERNSRSLEKDALLHNMAINAVGPALVAKHVLPLLPREGKTVFAALSARIGSISDNRLGSWYSYRASKAALNQIIKTLSIELARQRRGTVCVALHPGTVDSALSRPFQSSVPANKLFTAAYSAECLLAVIDALDQSRTGQLIAWDGSTIEP
jgi:NAD(P)-dependent dehydrogenase (short-subunit alcohol dehydrogenase family)